MLAAFTTRSRFYKLTVTLAVDCEDKSAEMTITYDRRILRIEAVSFYDVREPALAEAYLGRPMGERGSFVEALEWSCRHGHLRRHTSDDGAAIGLGA